MCECLSIETCISKLTVFQNSQLYQETGDGRGKSSFIKKGGGVGGDFSLNIQFGKIMK